MSMQPEIEETNNGTNSLVLIDPAICLVCGSADTDHTSDLSIIRHDIAELKATVQSLIDLITPIQQEINPMLEALAASPLGKMMGIGNG